MKVKPKDCAGTPWDFFYLLENHFPRRDIDVCANDENYKCPRFLHDQDDPLFEDWLDPGEDLNHGWCNPPYSKISPWLQKCAMEVKGRHWVTMLALVPATPGPAWWHNYATLADEIWFLRERIQFDAPPGIKYTTAMGDNALLLYRDVGLQREPRVVHWDWKMELVTDSPLHGRESLKRLEAKT